MSLIQWHPNKCVLTTAGWTSSVSSIDVCRDQSSNVLNVQWWFKDIFLHTVLDGVNHFTSRWWYFLSRPCVWLQSREESNNSWVKLQFITKWILNLAWWCAIDATSTFLNPWDKLRCCLWHPNNMIWLFSRSDRFYDDGMGPHWPSSCHSIYTIQTSYVISQCRETSAWYQGKAKFSFSRTCVWQSDDHGPLDLNIILENERL